MHLYILVFLERGYFLCAILKVYLINIVLCLCYCTGEIEVLTSMKLHPYILRLQPTLILEQKIAISQRGKIQTLSLLVECFSISVFKALVLGAN